MKSIRRFLSRIFLRKLGDDNGEEASVKENTEELPEATKSNRIMRSCSIRKRRKKSSKKKGDAESQRKTASEKSRRGEKSKQKKEVKQAHLQSERSVRRSSERSTKGRSRRGGHDDMTDKSFGRFRNLSGRVSRSVRTFVSRPMRDPAIKKFINRIEARRLAEMNNLLTHRGLRTDQEVYPRLRSSRSLERLRNGPDQVFADGLNPENYVRLPSSSVAEEMPLNKEKPAELVTENNDNGGKIIVNGLPFWMEGEEWRQIESDDSDTDDDLPLNGDIILDVHHGKINLEKMPAVPVILDPFEDLSELQRRDKLFFTKSILFGNSVRSAINLSDTTSAKSIRKRTKISPLSFDQPDSRFLYQRKRFWELFEDPYTVTCVERAIAHGQGKAQSSKNSNQREEQIAGPDDNSGSRANKNDNKQFNSAKTDGERNEQTGLRRLAVDTSMY